MFLLGHLGITLATVKVSMFVLGKLREASIALEPGVENSSHNPTSGRLSPVSPIDYRFLLLGAILPDLIDKTVGMVLLREQVANGRIFSHTLLFAMLLLHTGFLLSGEGRRMFLSLFIGVSFHIAFDGMWLHPHTLLWPLYGWSFPKGVPLGMVEIARNYLHTPFTTPILVAMGLEAIGGIVILIVMLTVFPGDRRRRFLRQGDL